MEEWSHLHLSFTAVISVITVNHHLLYYTPHSALPRQQVIYKLCEQDGNTCLPFHSVLPSMGTSNCLKQIVCVCVCVHVCVRVCMHTWALAQLCE